MKKILFFLFFAAIVYGQRKPGAQVGSAYTNSYNKVETRNLISDSLATLFAADTASMTAISTSYGRTCTYGGTEIGKGDFILVANGYTHDGGVILSNDNGGYWIRKTYIETGKKYSSNYATINLAYSNLISGDDLIIDKNYTVSSTLTQSVSAKITGIKNATLTLNPGGQHLIDVVGVSAEYRNLTFVGTFDTTTNFTDAATYVSGEKLLTFDYDNSDTVKNIFIENCIFRKSGTEALKLESDAGSYIRNFYVLVNKFYDCARAIYLEGVQGDSSGVENVYINFNTIKNTLWITDDVANSGMGIRTDQSFKNIYVIGNRVSGCGKNSIEMYSSNNAYYSFFQHVIISDNYFDYAGDRTFAAYGKDIKILNNTIKDSVDHIEIYGKNLIFSNNTCYNAPMFSKGYLANFQDDTENWKVNNNTFYFDSDFGTDENLIDWVGVRFGEFVDNTIDVSGSAAAGYIGTRVLSCINTNISGNTYIYRNATIDAQILSFSNSVNSRVNNNVVIIDSASTFSLTTAEGLFTIGNISYCEFKNNDIFSYTTENLTGAALMDRTGAIDSIAGWVSDGSTYSSFNIEGLRTVPVDGDSVNGQYYLIRTSNVATLSGAFADESGKLAKYDSGWEFYSIDDILLNLEIDYSASMPDSQYFSLPKGTVGDTIIVIDNGMIHNIITDNNLNPVGLMYTTYSQAQLMAAYLSGLSILYGNTFEFPDYGFFAQFTGYFNNAFLPNYADSYNSTFYYNVGQRIIYRNPVNQGDSLMVVGQICTAKGKPGTWKEIAYTIP